MSPLKHSSRTSNRGIRAASSTSHSTAKVDRSKLWAQPPIRKRRLIGPIWTDNAHESNLLVRATESAPMHAEELTHLLHDTVVAGGTSADRVRDWTLLRAAIERHGWS